MRMIYIAHPSAATKRTWKRPSQLSQNYCTSTRTVHSTRRYTRQFFRTAISEGMEHCFEVLRRCDELWIAGDWRESRGCNMEYGFAKAKGIPIKFVGGLNE